MAEQWDGYYCIPPLRQKRHDSSPMCCTYGAYIAFILRSILHPLHHTGTVSELSAKLITAFISLEFSGCITSIMAVLESVYLTG